MSKVEMEGTSESFKWVYDFRRQEPARFAGLLAIIITVLAVVYFTWPEGAGVFWTLLGVILLSFWLLPFFVPITYELNDEGVSVYYGSLQISSKLWSHYTRCVYDEYGMALKTMVVDSWLDKYRGCFMRFPREMDKRSSIIDFVGKKLKVYENTAYARKVR
jgi:hypothetical protein